MDFREKCGYTKHEVNFHPLNNNNNEHKHAYKCFCYYANETNEYFSDKLDEQQIAKVYKLISLLFFHNFSLDYFQVKLSSFLAYNRFKRTKWYEFRLFPETM